MGDTDPTTDDSETTVPTTTIQVAEPIQERLRERGADIGAETYNDTIAHLLDETQEEIALDEVIHRAVDEYGGFENIAALYAEHPGSFDGQRPFLFQLKIYTGSAEGLEESVDIVGAHHRVVIETNDGDLRLPVDIMATVDGPKDWDHAEGTPLYLSDTVLGAEPIELDEGIENLRTKFGETND